MSRIHLASAFRKLVSSLFTAYLLGCTEKPKELPKNETQKIRIVSWNLNWFPGRTDNATDEEAKTHMEQANFIPTV